MRPCSCISCTVQRLTDQVARERKLMSIFKELAAGVRGDMENFKDQARELMEKREELRRRGELQFARYREHHQDVEHGLNEMEDALRELEGGNSRGSQEATGSTADRTFQKPGSDSNGS